MTKRITFTALVHGESGVGKSWLGDTVPGPRLIIDLEGRAHYTPSGPKIYWDPKTQACPEYDGTWETCIVSVYEYGQLQLVYDWLRSGKHPFVSVVIDSLMEAQKRCIDSIVGAVALKQEDWGTLLRKLEALVRQFRDLTMLPDEIQSIHTVIFIVGSKLDDGVYRPLLQGAIMLQVPYYLDVVGYLFMQPQQDASLPPIRTLLVHKYPGYVAKDNTNKLPGPYIANPNISQLRELLEHPPAAPAPVQTTQEVAA